MQIARESRRGGRDSTMLQWRGVIMNYCKQQKKLFLLQQRRGSRRRVYILLWNSLMPHHAVLAERCRTRLISGSKSKESSETNGAW
jgi:hypothetical protein